MTFNPGLILLMWGAIIATGMGDFLSKRYSVDPHWWIVVYVVLFYTVGVLCWLGMLVAYKNLARAGMIWIVMSTVVLLVLSHFVFHEPITARQWCGIVVGIGSVALLL